MSEKTRRLQSGVSDGTTYQRFFLCRKSTTKIKVPVNENNAYLKLAKKYDSEWNGTQLKWAKWHTNYVHLWIAMVKGLWRWWKPAQNFQFSLLQKVLLTWTWILELTFQTMNRHELKYSCTCRKFSSKTICEINSKAYQLSGLKDPLL